MPDPVLADVSEGCRLSNYVLATASAEVFDFTQFKQLLQDVTQADSFVLNGSESVMTFQCPWDMAYSAYIYCLGFDYVEDVGGTDLLRRIPPVAHPRYPFMRCVSVSVEGVLPNGTTRPADLTVIATPAKSANYTAANFLLRFQHFTAPVKADSQMPQDGSGEYARYIEVFPEPAPPELLSVENQRTLEWAEGALAGQNTVAPFGFIKQTMNYRLRWRGVPSTWLMETYYYPKRLAEFNRGTLNSTEFLGFPAGTLKFDGYSLTPYHYPIKTLTLPAIAYDVEILFSYFDPPPVSTTRGHNLLPQFNSGAISWALATSDGTTGGSKLWNVSADFRDMFKSAKNP